MFTESQVLALAPDASSVKAGKKLANSSLWSLLKYSDQAIWGEIKGSGKKPYQARIDTSEIAFKCSCPSRKFPCKHALALLLVFANEKHAFSQAEEPEWVKNWLEQRKGRAQAKATKVKKPVDEKARQKRIVKREKKVADGLLELKKWVLDTLRNGIAHLPDKDYAYFEGLASRMVDAQAPGIATIFRSFSQLNYQHDSWKIQAAEKLCALWLITCAHQSSASLDIAIQEELKDMIGWKRSKEEVLSKTGIQDTWQVLGMEEFEDSRIKIQKYWLLGEKTGTKSYTLQYIVPGQIREMSLIPGMSVEAELYSYGAGISQRGLLKESKQTKVISHLSGYKTLEACKDDFSSELSKNPWINSLCVVLEEVIPIKEGNSHYLLDKEQKLIELVCSDEGMWKMLAISGGNSIAVAGVSDALSFTPLGMLVHGQYQLLDLNN